MKVMLCVIDVDKTSGIRLQEAREFLSRPFPAHHHTAMAPVSLAEY